MTEPRTEAGRALSDALDPLTHYGTIINHRDDILAIEREAYALGEAEGGRAAIEQVTPRVLVDCLYAAGFPDIAYELAATLDSIEAESDAITSLSQ